MKRAIFLLTEAEDLQVTRFMKALDLGIAGHIYPSKGLQITATISPGQICDKAWIERATASIKDTVEKATGIRYHKAVLLKIEEIESEKTDAKCDDPKSSRPMGRRKPRRRAT